MRRNNSNSKTYKREVAFALLVFICCLALTDKLQALEMMVLPIFTFAAMAYGMDWGSKQTELTRGKKDGNSEDHS